jgi:hypothetical protein
MQTTCLTITDGSLAYLSGQTYVTERALGAELSEFNLAKIKLPGNELISARLGTWNK